MSLPFALVYLGVLAFQGLTTKLLLRKSGPLWGYYCFKLVAFPLWAALTFTGPLAILPGIFVLIGSCVLLIIVTVISLATMFGGDPTLIGQFSDKPEYADDRHQLNNKLMLFWGLTLLILSIAGTIGLM